MTSLDAIQLARKLQDECKIDGTPVSKLAHLNCWFLNRLYESICGPIIEEWPLLPPIEDDQRYIQYLLDFISCDLLNVDLDHISAQKVVSGDPEHIFNLLTIFNNIRLCVQSDQQAQTTGQSASPIPQPVKKTKSVLYTPRTAFHKSKSAKVLKIATQHPISKSSQRIPVSKTAILTNAVKMKSYILERNMDKDIFSKRSKLSVAPVLSSPARRKMDTIEMRRAHLALENAKKRLKQKQIAVQRSKENMDRIKESHKLREKQLSEMAGQELTERWQQASKEAEMIFAAKIREENWKKYKTVIDRIQKLEERQKHREFVIREKFQLDEK